MPSWGVTGHPGALPTEPLTAANFYPTGYQLIPLPTPYWIPNWALTGPQPGPTRISTGPQPGPNWVPTGSPRVPTGSVPGLNWVLNRPLTGALLYSSVIMGNALTLKTDTLW